MSSKTGRHKLERIASENVATDIKRERCWRFLFDTYFRMLRKGAFFDGRREGVLNVNYFSLDPNQNCPPKTNTAAHSETDIQNHDQPFAC